MVQNREFLVLTGMPFFCFVFVRFLWFTLCFSARMNYLVVLVGNFK